MKAKFIAVLLLLSTIIPARQANAQIIEVIRGAAKKVIRAIDLRIQRQQNKVIWLQNAQKELENTISKLKLREISEWTEKQRKLYDDYFKELWQVKNAITTFQKVKQIMERQLMLVSEYKRAWDLLRKDPHFTAAEIQKMMQIYTGILDESLKNIDQLILVTNSFSTQMSDGKRLELISSAGTGVEGNLTDLRLFNNRNFRVSVSRASSINQAELLKKVYGIK